jgi:hypothetical protein
LITALAFANKCGLKPRSTVNLNFDKKATATKTIMETVQMNNLALRSFFAMVGWSMFFGLEV